MSRSDVEDGMGFAGLIGGSPEEREIDLLEQRIQRQRNELVALKFLNKALLGSLDPQTLMAIADMVEPSNIHQSADLAERIRIMARNQFAALANDNHRAGDTGKAVRS